MKPKRRVEILKLDLDSVDGPVVNGRWIKLKSFTSIRAGDIFRLFDSVDGKESPDEVVRGRHVINVALTDAKPMPPPSLGVVETTRIHGFPKRREKRASNCSEKK
jgi:hypothetical protein